MKKILALLLGAALAISITACGGSPASSGTSSTSGDKSSSSSETEEQHDDVKLSAWYFQVAGIDPMMEEWAANVHEQYPWLTIELECIPSDTGPEKFTVACATGTTPDIYFDGYSRIAPAVFADLTADVSDVYEANKDIFFNPQTDGIVDGQYRYIGYEQGAPYAICVNMSLAEKLGVKDMLPEDKLTWSYDDLLNICRKAKEADPTVIPISLFAGTRSGDAWDYSFFLGAGGTILNEDHTATTVNDDGNKEKVAGVFEFYKALMDEGLVSDGAASMIDLDVINLFNTGQVLFESAWAFNGMSTTYTNQQDGTCAEFDYDGYALPTPDGKAAPDCASWGSFGFCVFKNNNVVDEAKLAVDVFLKDSDLIGRLITTDGKLPLVNNVKVDYATDSIAEAMARATEYGAAHAKSDFGILEPFWSDFRETFYVLKQDLFTGNITPEQFCEKWAETGDKVISDYYAAQ